MAYAALYEFNFLSTNGKDILIRINADGYVGSVKSRHVGGAPQLRLEQNGNIKGMSLEFPAECEIEDEYASLYTSNPYKFLVELEVESTVVWRGFITPELYSSPWIDPPYDVTLTATDGLGELKMHTFPALGSQTLEAFFATLLGATGLNLPMKAISTAFNDVVDDQYLFSRTTVNLNHLAGKTYYDVLDALLTALHATIQQSGTEWILIRETDVTAMTENAMVYDTSGMSYPIVPFGSMQSNDIWPIGRLRMEIVPAKNSVKVSAANQFKESLLADPDMIEGGWSGDGTHYSNDGGFYALERGQMILQDWYPTSIGLDGYPDFFDLKFSYRQSGRTPVDLHVVVEATGINAETGEPTLLAWLNTTDGLWIETEQWHRWMDVSVPQATYGNASDCTETTIAIKMFGYLTERLSRIDKIRFAFVSTANTIYIHHSSVAASSLINGINTTLVLDNAARGTLSDIEPPFADTFVGNHGLQFMNNAVYGIQSGSNYSVLNWGSDAIPLVPYGEWLAKDNAFSVATPRLRLQGKLNMPAGQVIPPFFYSTGGLTYICETYSHDLLNDEAEVSLITLPAASIQVVSVRQTAYGEDGEEIDSSVSVFPASFNLAAGDTTTRCYIAISCPSTMSWTVTGLPEWVDMSVEDQSGTGPGTISFVLTANSGDARQAVITVAGLPVSIYQQSASGDYTLTFAVTPAGVTYVLTLDGEETQYTAGMPVSVGTAVGVTISKQGYSTLTDSFTMPGENTVKTYTLTASVRATESHPLVISKSAQSVQINVSDPSNHGWVLDYSNEGYFGYVTGGSVVSGNVTLANEVFRGTGDAVVSLSVSANNNAYDRNVGGSDLAPIYFVDDTLGSSYRSYVSFMQQGTNSSSVSVSSVTLNKNSTSIAAGSSEKLTATVSPSNATNPTLSWTSTNTSVAQVGQDGTIYAVAAGSATIRASATDGSNKSATCAVTVTGSAGVAVTGVTLSHNSISVPIGGTFLLTATVAPSNASNKAVSWRSTATSVATVDSSGLVTGVSRGACRIYVTTVDGGYEAYCSVNVTNSGTISADDVTVKSQATSASTPLRTSNMTSSTLAGTCAAAWVNSVTIDKTVSPYRVRMQIDPNTLGYSRSATVTVTGTDTGGVTRSTTFTLTQNGRNPSETPCTGLTMNGVADIHNSDNLADYSVNFEPQSTMQNKVVWAVTDRSGNATSYAEIVTSSDDRCSVRVLSGANNALLRVKATNYYNSSIYVTKDITATYVAPSTGGRIEVNESYIEVAADATSDNWAQVTLVNMSTSLTNLGVAVSGFITSASVGSDGKVTVAFPANTGSARSGSVTLSGLTTGGQSAQAIITYLQQGKGQNTYGFDIQALEVTGTTDARFAVMFFNETTGDATVSNLAYTLTGYNSSSQTTFTKTGSLTNRTVAALATEETVYSVTIEPSGPTTRYVLTITSNVMTDTYEGDGTDPITT